MGLTDGGTVVMLGEKKAQVRSQRTSKGQLSPGSLTSLERQQRQIIFGITGSNPSTSRNDTMRKSRSRKFSAGRAGLHGQWRGQPVQTFTNTERGQVIGGTTGLKGSRLPMNS